MLSHAMDWRFFLPISKEARILLICNDPQEYVERFKRLGVLSIDPVPHPSAALEISIPSSAFDLILAPQGLRMDPAFESTEGQLSMYQRLADLLAPDGMLFVGFSNRWRSGSRSTVNGFQSSPRKISHALRAAGFNEIKFLGVMGSLATPDYLLPLESQAISFVLHHKFRRKIPAQFGRLFFHPWISAAFRHFLGAYFVMATASGR